MKTNSEYTLIDRDAFEKHKEEVEDFSRRLITNDPINAYRFYTFIKNRFGSREFQNIYDELRIETLRHNDGSFESEYMENLLLENRIAFLEEVHRFIMDKAIWDGKHKEFLAKTKEAIDTFYSVKRSRDVHSRHK